MEYGSPLALSPHPTHLNTPNRQISLAAETQKTERGIYSARSNSTTTMPERREDLETAPLTLKVCNAGLHELEDIPSAHLALFDQKTPLSRFCKNAEKRHPGFHINNSTAPNQLGRIDPHKTSVAELIQPFLDKPGSFFVRIE
jgi:hypothetical protein